MVKRVSSLGSNLDSLSSREPQPFSNGRTKSKSVHGGGYFFKYVDAAKNSKSPVATSPIAMPISVKVPL